MSIKNVILHFFTKIFRITKNKIKLIRNGLISNIRLIVILVIFNWLSFVSYQYNLVIFLLFYVFLAYIGLKNIKKEYQIYLIIVLWLVLNINIVLLEKDIVSIDKVNLYVACLNTLIIAWSNIVLYFIFCKIIYNNSKDSRCSSKKYVYITVLFNIITALALYKYIPNSYYVFSFLFAVLYCYCIRILFDRFFLIFLNFMCSISSIITTISGICIVLITQKLYFPENDLRYGCTTSITFLNYFQITTLSSILAYYTPSLDISKHKLLSKIIVFFLISLGIIIQFLLLRFLKY